MFTELEWQILRAVWDSQPATSREIVDSLESRTGSSRATIKTMLHRLVDKEALHFQRKGNRYLYWANLSRAEGTSRACRQLLDVVFDGQPAHMLSYLTASCDLTYHQAQYLRELLGDIEDACLKSMQREAANRLQQSDAQRSVA